MHCKDRESIFTVNLSRRDFIKTTVSGVAVLTFGCSDSDDNSNKDENSNKDLSYAIENDDVLFALYSKENLHSQTEAIRLASEKLNWSWLSAGDSVFVKISMNSAHTHPAVTSPIAISAICKELFDRGASRVIVGDKMGLESVYHHANGISGGSTREAAGKNDILEAIEHSNAEAYFFDETDFNTDFFEATLNIDSTHWQTPPYLPNIVKEVDHIIYLPRLSSHIAAGYSHGLKSAVGWLRDDSRIQMHTKADTLHEKYAEISFADEIRSKHRLTLTFAEKILLDSGPDDGTISELNPNIIIASGHLANHDAFSVAVLAYIDSITEQASNLVYNSGMAPVAHNYLMLNMLPGLHKDFPAIDPNEYSTVQYNDYQKGISSDIALSRAYQILGGVPSSISVEHIGEEIDPVFREFITHHNNNIFTLKLNT
jgi:uncharacterized protein (DUF362 family)